MLLCPTCDKPLGDLRLGERFEAICAGCRYKFQVVSGMVSDRSTWPVATRPATANAPATFEQAYTLHLRAAERTEVAAFQLPSGHAPVAVAPGDRVAVVYTMRGDERAHLVQVRNYTSGDIYQIAHPRGRSAMRAALVAFVAMTVTIAAALSWEWPGLAILVAMTLVFGGTFVGVMRLLEPTHELPADALASRVAAQSLLAQKHDLELRRARVAADREDKARLRDRLRALREKMREVALPAYEARIASLDRAVATLDEQIALDDRLHDGYDRSVKILEIELESGAAADAMSGDVAAAMQDRLAELRALEEQHAELGRQLEANAEVERLLPVHRA